MRLKRNWNVLKFNVIAHIVKVYFSLERMLHISTVKLLSLNLYGFIQYISTSLAMFVKHCLIWETDGLHNHVIKN